MVVERVFRPDRDIAEETVTHRRLTFGMMAGRSDRAKGPKGLSAHDEVDGLDHGAGRPPDGGKSAGGHVGVRVEASPPGIGRSAADGVDMRLWVDAQHTVIGAKRRGQSKEVKVFEGGQHSVKTGHLFRVSGRRDVAETVRMCDQSNRHLSKEQDAVALHKGCR